MALQKSSFRQISKSSGLLLVKPGRLFRRNFLLVVFVFVCLGLMGWTIPQAKRVVRVGVYENPPNIYTSSEGIVTGLWPDIINAIAEKENWQIVWVSGTLDENLTRLAKNKIGIMPDVGWSEGRALEYTFSSETVIMSWARLYVPQGSKVETILDLDGKRVAGLNGSLNFDGPEGIISLAQKFNVQCTFVALDSYADVFEALQNKEVDAGVTNKDFGELNEGKYAVSRTPIIIAPSNLRFAFSKNAKMTPYLQSTIDTDLQEFKNNPDSIYYTALEKYREGTPEPSLVKVVPSWVYVVAVYGTSAILLLLVAVVLARRQIKLQTNALKTSETRHRELVENIPDQIFRLSKEGVFLDYHASVEHGLYVPADAFLGKNLMQVLPKEVGELTLQKIAAAFETGEIQTFEYQLPSEGQLKDYEARLKSIGENEVISIIRDITASKLTERELRESEVRYQTLTTLVPVGIFHTNAAGLTTYVNPSWCKISGMPAEEALDNGWLETVHPDDREPLQTNWQDSTRSNRPSNAEYRFIHPDGSLTWVIGQAVPEYDSAGQIIGYVGTITDITERKKMEELKEAVLKAESADKLKSAFLATMSHELRTPLNSIIGFTGILLQKMVGPLSKEQDKQLRMIQSSARHLLELINDVLDISKIEAGQMTVVSEPFDMRDAVNSCLEKIQPFAEKKGLKLTTIIPPDPLQVISDRRRVEQIVLNLLNNAVKFTNSGGVQVECRLDGKQIITIITDTGIGIKAEDVNTLFRPFSQVQTGLTRQYTGTGLGLSICKSLVELLGGRISVKSEWGKGSEFTFTLPLQREVS